MSHMLPIYEYEILPYDEVVAIFKFTEDPGAYLSEDSISKELKRILSQGFRWVRSEGDFAVFEREYNKIKPSLKK